MADLQVFVEWDNTPCCKVWPGAFEKYNVVTSGGAPVTHRTTEDPRLAALSSPKRPPTRTQRLPEAAAAPVNSDTDISGPEAGTGSPSRPRRPKVVDAAKSTVSRLHELWPNYFRYLSLKMDPT